MSKRIDQLNENALFKELTMLRTEFDALKNSQRAGSENVNITRIVSGNAVDITVTVTYNDISILEVTITPAYETFSESIFLWHVFWIASIVAGAGEFYNFTEVLPNQNGSRIARLYLMGTSPADFTTFDIRAVAYCIGDATLSVAQIA